MKNKIFLAVGLCITTMSVWLQGSLPDGTPSLVPLIQSLISQATEESPLPESERGVANTAFGNGGVVDFGVQLIPLTSTVSDDQKTMFFGGYAIGTNYGFTRAFNTETGDTLWSVTEIIEGNIKSVLYNNGVVYSLGIDTIDDQLYLYIKARDAVTGALLTTYFTNGTATFDDADFTDARALAYVNNALFVLATDGANSYLYKLNATTGAIDQTFNSGTYITLTGQSAVGGLAYADGFIYTLSNNDTDSTLKKINATTGVDDLTGTITGAISKNPSTNSLQVYQEKVWVLTVNDATATTTIHKFDLSSFSTALSTLDITGIKASYFLPYQNTFLIAGETATPTSIAVSYLIESNTLDTTFGANGYYAYTAGPGFPTFSVLSNLESIVYCTLKTATTTTAMVYVTLIDSMVEAAMRNSQNADNMEDTGLK